jgi:magnesium chelatase subunit D
MRFAAAATHHAFPAPRRVRATRTPRRGRPPRGSASPASPSVARAGGASSQEAFTPPAFPLSSVVDHEAAKVALVLAAVDPRAGGVALLGGHGTCKSTLARSLRPLLPRIETVRGSAHNADPEEKRRKTHASSSIDDSNFSEDSAASKDSSLATEIRDAPFLTIPLGATEDAVLGSVDIERSAATGEAAFSPGILARANRGVLFFDDANLLDDAVVDAALRATDAGYNAVEREGISTGHPCRCITIAAVNPSEGDVRATVLDRFAAVVGVDESLGDEKKKINADGGSETRREDVAARVAAATVASRWRDDWQSVLDECADREEDLRLDIAMARARIEAGAVAVPDWAIEFLVARAARGECRGHRAEICAAKLARAAAALRGADRVGRQDLRVAVELAIRPRDTVDVLDDDVPEEAPEDEEGGDEERDSAAREEVPDEDEDEDEDVDEDRAEDDGTDTRDVLPDASFVFEPTESELDVSASLLRAFEAAAKRRRRHESGTAAARSRSKASARDYERGRYVKSEFPRGGVIKKIAVDATLRAAAVHQFSRRRRRGIDSGSPDAHRVWIEKDDLRIKRMSRKAGVLTVFAVDASGSMALHRADIAKGAALTLLKEAYKRRDSVAVVAYGGAFAATLLPPSRSLALARTRMSSIPSGGGTPLSHGLVTAGRVARDAAKFRAAVGSAKVVLITDGGANVSLATSVAAERRARKKSQSQSFHREEEDEDEDEEEKDEDEDVPSKAALREEALTIAKRLGKAGVRLFVVDASRRFDTESGSDSRDCLPRALARAARGAYYRLSPTADAIRAGETLAGVVDA